MYENTSSCSLTMMTLSEMKEKFTLGKINKNTNLEQKSKTQCSS